jgi:hypothetical protein
MTEHDEITNIKKPIKYRLDGQWYETDQKRQPAAAILGRAGLDPALYDLGQMHNKHESPERFSDQEIVKIHDGDRFVSIRERADVA